MSNDGAARKVSRLNELVRKIRDHGEKGIAVSHITAWSERKLGISETTTRNYLMVLQRNREIKEEHGRLIFIASEYV